MWDSSCFSWGNSQPCWTRRLWWTGVIVETQGWCWVSSSTSREPCLGSLSWEHRANTAGRALTHPILLPELYKQLSIQNSHNTQLILLQYAPFPTLSLVYILRVVFFQANWDDNQFSHGTPHAKLFIAQGLYCTHFPARMWNDWSELSFLFPALTNLPLKEIQLHSGFLYSFFSRSQAPCIPVPAGVYFQSRWHLL